MGVGSPSTTSAPAPPDGQASSYLEDQYLRYERRASLRARSQFTGSKRARGFILTSLPGDYQKPFPLASNCPVSWGNVRP